MKHWVDLGWWQPGGGHDAVFEALRGIEITPSWIRVYNAFETTPFDKVKVIILGQDPYPTKGDAMGLAFSVRKAPERIARVPPSLLNIMRELDTDVGGVPDSLLQMHCDLTPWAVQGVLLLNTILTTEPGKSMAHVKVGWDKLVNAALLAVAKHRKNVVFILWGKGAEAAFNDAMLDGWKAWQRENSHLVLRAPHPSPRSANRGFFGSCPFSKTNKHLITHGETPIDWSL